MLQAIIHYSLHFIAPALLAYVFFGREQFWSAYGVMLLSMAVDLDHLLATPIFDPHRMSIGFHPLHSYPAIAVYVLFCLIPKKYFVFPWWVRALAIALVFHMITDFQDYMLWTR